MMRDVTMPRLSDSMEEGTILRWLAQTGQTVGDGEELLEVETDKATMTCPAEGEGVLEILVQEGATVPVGTVIGRLGAGVAASQGPTSMPDESAGPSAGVDEARSEMQPVREEPRASRQTQPSSAGHPRSNGRHAGGSPAASTPLARRIARAHGIELSAVHGSGPGGRITKSDVLALSGAPAKQPTAPVVAAARAAEASLQPLSNLQRLIAQRMCEVKSTVPEFQVQTEARMDEAIALRNSLKQLAGEEQPVPSINDIVVKACAIALRRHPRANSSYSDDGVLLHPQINIGVAVSAEHALVVPTILDADEKSLGEIARQTRLLADRVRSGQITPEELTRGTFTVSNLGMFGMTAIAPVINPGQAAILGVGAMRSVLRRVDEEILDATLVTLTLTCDHRILYGADASMFLDEVRSLLESPLRLVL